MSGNVIIIYRKTALLCGFWNIEKVCGIVFDIGQTVLYGSNGVCTVAGVTEKRVGSFKANYYVLKPVSANSATLFVRPASALKNATNVFIYSSVFK